MQNYQQTVKELFDLQAFAIKLGLDNITSLCNAVNNPQLSYPVIHIAGTNGKGSTAFYIAQMLQSLGLKVGLFTSPHLIDFKERIRVNDALINDKYIVEFWNTIKKQVYKLKATFFDTTTFMAFHYFREMNVDVAVFETGLGGRLDSTNIVKPQISVITPIGFDHQKHLGDNIKKIAAEKAGIIKPDSHIFISEQPADALTVLMDKTNETNKIHYLPDCIKTENNKTDFNGTSFTIKDLHDNEVINFDINTIASYQIQNFALAYKVVKSYCKENNILIAIESVKKKTKNAVWPGRLQIVKKNPNVIFDVSHNLPGIIKTVDTLRNLIKKEHLHLLLGLVNDKDVKKIAEYLSANFKKIIITEPDTYRKQDGLTLLNEIKKKQPNSELVKDLKIAYEKSVKELNNTDTLVALGSHYLIGPLLSDLT